MSKLGLPVPPVPTITTEACREYLSRGSEPATYVCKSRWHCDSCKMVSAAASATDTIHYQ